VKNNYKHFKELPSDEQIEAEFVLTSDILRAHGFDHYEVSNFAKAGARAKHNIRYWQGKSVAAIGPSAVGYLAPTGHRYKWKGQQDEFEIEELSSEAIELERVYLSLRLDSGLVDFEKGFSPEQKARYQILYQGWLNAGWINLNSDRKDLCLSPAGFLMMDSVIESLMKAELIK